jgi:acyl carrier protein|tara:strand:- start:44 stop:274 length:231 start_codon:yes stop_codon:yes gene_type:complete
MKIKVLLEKLYEELEIESVNSLTVNTKLDELDEWDSLTILSLISFIETEFSVNLSATEIENFVILKDLVDKLDLKD